MGRSDKNCIQAWLSLGGQFMKNRTFLTTLVLFVLLFNLGIFIISIAIFEDTINRAKERSLGEHYFIVSALIKDFHAVNSRGIEINETLDSLLQPYGYLSVDKKSGLALYEDNQLVYCDRFIKVLQSIRLEIPENGERKISTKRVDNHTYVIVSGKIPSPYNSYEITYLYDMTDEINTWSKMKNILFLVGFILSCLLALALLVLLNQIFRPLAQISKTSRNIATGAYETRLPVSGSDELSEMAKSFNYMAEEIQNQMTDLIDTAKKKQQFIDNFAHELRTPLTAIYGYAEYLQKAIMTEDDRLSALDYIMSESRRLQTIAYELMELANLKNNEISWEKQKVSDLFESVKQTLHLKIIEKKIDIDFICEIDNILGDACLLKSLLVNLIDNAIKACNLGGHIVIRATIEDDKKIINIQDNGKGMTSEVLSQITEPFYRAEKSRNRSDGGAGLGLAISKQIVLCHNANIDFTSSLGKGTTVKITFTTS